MKAAKKIVVMMVVAFGLVATSCKKNNELSLWNDDAPAKKALVEYVQSVTKKGSADFIPVENHIAVFDLDGTLFCETNPTYFDFQLFVHRVLGFGNSLTDASMVNYAQYNEKYKSLGFMLCCDDLEREYGNIAKADKMRADCEKNGWIAISMRNDWKTIYGEGVKKR